MKMLSGLLILTLSLPALAGLGDLATTTPAGAAAGSSAIRRAVPARTYTIQDVQARGGVMIREYLAADGRVVAVSWNGPVMPNLEQLLSTYFEPYREELAKRGPSRGPVVLRRDNLVVEAGGHMRSFRGRAYLPGLLPADLPIDEIK